VRVSDAVENVAIPLLADLAGAPSFLFGDLFPAGDSLFMVLRLNLVCRARDPIHTGLPPPESFRPGQDRDAFPPFPPLFGLPPF